MGYRFSLDQFHIEQFHLIDLNRLPRIADEATHLGKELLMLADCIVDHGFSGLRWIDGNDPAVGYCIFLASAHNEHGCGIGQWLLKIDLDTFEGKVFATAHRAVFECPYSCDSNLVSRGVAPDRDVL